MRAHFEKPIEQSVRLDSCLSLRLTSESTFDPGIGGVGVAEGGVGVGGVNDAGVFGVAGVGDSDISNSQEVDISASLSLRANMSSLEDML